jgi:hypothetical protein
MSTDSVSIETAIRVANRRIKWPSMAVLVTPLLGYALAGKLHLVPTTGYAGMCWAVPLFLGAFVGSWLIWSLRVPQWMLWAYPRVKNLCELKQQAIDENIIWPDGSIFNRTLIMSTLDRQKLRDIEHDS